MMKVVVERGSIETPRPRVLTREMQAFIAACINSIQERLTGGLNLRETYDECREKFTDLRVIFVSCPEWLRFESLYRSLKSCEIKVVVLN